MRPTLTKGPNGFLGWRNAFRRRQFYWAKL